MTVKELEIIVSELKERVNVLELKLEKQESKKGPLSTREMTPDDAERIINGDLKDISHKKAAEQLGLSYGQIYSARGGYTFKSIERK